MTDLWLDFRQALRVFARHRGPFVLAAACLALGVAITSTMFASADPWLFRPLPYAEPERLAAVFEVHSRRGATWQGVSTPSYFDWTRQSTAVEQWGALVRVGYNLSTAEEPERIAGARITASLFPTLGARPTAGRTFSPAEDRPGGPRVCLISHALWQRRFGGSNQALGGEVRIDGEDHTVVGIMGPGWAYPEYAEVWTPLALDTGERDRSVRVLDVVARLRGGVSLAQAEQELGAIASRTALEHPESSAGWGVKVVKVPETLTPPGIRAALVLMLAASAFVLLIACANVASLLLAQALDRRHEIATRLALGASPGRLVRQLLTESLLLALAGGAVGVLLAFCGMGLLTGSVPVRPPFWAVMELGPRTLVVALASSVLAAVAFGVVPALQCARFDVRTSLRDGERGTAGGRRPRRLGDGLVAAELAVCLVLASGAALMVRSFWERQRVHPGFEVRDALSARVALSGARYREAAQRVAFVDEALRRMRELPGVEAAAAVTALPMTDELGGGWSSVAVEAQDGPVPVAERPSAAYQAATAEGLAALGIPLLSGRFFRESEVADATAVAVVSEGVARRLWPEADAVGQRLRLGDGPWLRVVGVAGEVREPSSILGDIGRPPGQVYVPYGMDPSASVYLVVRGSQPAALAASMRQRMAALDASLPLYGVRTLEEARRLADWVARLWGQILAWAAGGALLLTCTGVYGVVSRGVARRTREIGVRMALGADRGDVLGLFLTQGLRLAAIGVGAGLLGALLLNRSLAGLLYGVSPSDPLTLAGTALTLAAVTLLATCAPALQATRVDPTTALRSE
jgi:putative ABC transport system permease protein